MVMCVTTHVKLSLLAKNVGLLKADSSPDKQRRLLADGQPTFKCWATCKERLNILPTCYHLIFIAQLLKKSWTIYKWTFINLWCSILSIVYILLSFINNFLNLFFNQQKLIWCAYIKLHIKTPGLCKFSKLTKRLHNSIQT